MTLKFFGSVFSKSELATAMPQSGGTYVYIERAFGPLFGTITGIGLWLSMLLKSSFAHDKIGESDKAEELLSKLKSNYPKFKAETIIPGTKDSTSEAAN